MVLERDKHDIPSSLHDDVGRRVPVMVLNELWAELLVNDGTRWGRVISNSMHPMISRGDQVLVKKVLLDNVHFGDIVVFKRNDQLTIHRVLGRREFSGESHFLEKGDAILQSSFIPAVSVIGRVCAIKNSAKVVPTTVGRGRVLQLVLALISYGSLRLWAVLEYVLTFGRHTKGCRRPVSFYNRLSRLVQKAFILSIERSFDRVATG